MNIVRVTQPFEDRGVFQPSTSTTIALYEYKKNNPDSKLNIIDYKTELVTSGSKLKKNIKHFLKNESVVPDLIHVDAGKYNYLELFSGYYLKKYSKNSKNNKKNI